MTSMLKRVDNAVQAFIDDFVDGKRQGRQGRRQRPEDRRRRPGDLRRLHRRHQEPDRRLPAEDHRRRHQGSDRPRDPCAGPLRRARAHGGTHGGPGRMCPGPPSCRGPGRGSRTGRLVRHHAASTASTARRPDDRPVRRTIPSPHRARRQRGRAPAAAPGERPTDAGAPAQPTACQARTRWSCAGSPSGSPASSPTATSSCGSRRGEVHAIVGENGAGKSTLMKTLYGMHRPDEGTILLDGREVHFRSPADAIAAGIGMVHQHFMLADNFTVLENIVLGSEPTRGGRLDRAEGRAPDPRDLRPLRPRPRPRRAGRGPRRRRPAAGGDRQGALPRRHAP